MLTRTRTFFERRRIAVACRGEEVVLKVGNAELQMGYNEALALSQMLRLQGKKAKRFAGDTSSNFSVMADLTDANPYPKKGRSFVSFLKP